MPTPRLPRTTLWPPCRTPITQQPRRPLGPSKVENLSSLAKPCLLPQVPASRWASAPLLPAWPGECLPPPGTAALPQESWGSHRCPQPGLPRACRPALWVSAVASGPALPVGVSCQGGPRLLPGQSPRSVSNLCSPTHSCNLSSQHPTGCLPTPHPARAGGLRLHGLRVAPGSSTPACSVLTRSPSWRDGIPHHLSRAASDLLLCSWPQVPAGRLDSRTFQAPPTAEPCLVEAHSTE